MITVVCTDHRKAVRFTRNGGRPDDIMAVAMMLLYGHWEYWFSIGGTGKHYKTLAGAKRAAVRDMDRLGYHFDEKTINEAKFNDQEGGQQ